MKTCIHSFVKILFPYRSLQSVEQNSLTVLYSKSLLIVYFRNSSGYMIIHVSTLSLPPPACFLGPGNFSSFLHLCLSFLSNLIGTTGLDFTYGQYHVFAFLFLTQGLFFPCHTGHRICLGAGRWRGRGICRRGTQSLRCSRTNRAPQKSPRSPSHRSSGNPSGSMVQRPSLQQ